MKKGLVLMLLILFYSTSSGENLPLSRRTVVISPEELQKRIDAFIKVYDGMKAKVFETAVMLSKAKNTGEGIKAVVEMDAYFETKGEENRKLLDGLTLDQKSELYNQSASSLEGVSIAMIRFAEEVTIFNERFSSDTEGIKKFSESIIRFYNTFTGSFF